MKTLLSIILLFAFISCFAQKNEFKLDIKIVDKENNPISDVYILNFRNLDKNISLANGIFTIKVQPDDSLLFEHISYNRKIIRVFELLKNPIVVLFSDTVIIPEISVSPDSKNDYERARENLSFIKELDIPEYTKIKVEEPTTHQLMKEHNKVLRSEAGSVTFVRFSPSEQIGRIVRKIKKKKKDKN